MGRVSPTEQVTEKSLVLVRLHLSMPLQMQHTLEWTAIRNPDELSMAAMPIYDEIQLTENEKAQLSPSMHQAFPSLLQLVFLSLSVSAIINQARRLSSWRTNLQVQNKISMVHPSLHHTICMLQSLATVELT